VAVRAAGCGDGVDAASALSPVGIGLALCLDCQRPVEVWRGRPVISGCRVLVRCPSCADLDLARSVAVSRATRGLGPGAHDLSPWASSVDPRATVSLRGLLEHAAAWIGVWLRRSALVAGLVAGVIVVVALAAGLRYSDRGRSAVAASLTRGLRPVDENDTKTRILEVWSHQEAVPQRADQWVYPIAEVHQEFPLSPGAKFGAIRGGGPSEREDCHGGHCGVDLYATRGTPVLAVADGVVRRVHRQHGLSAGLFVHLAHADGSETFYMHLDEIREDLARDMRVARGEWLGALGRSGIRESPAHLHFVLKRGGSHQNPEPKLADARVIAIMDMTVGLSEDWSPPAAPAAEPARTAGAEPARAAEAVPSASTPPKRTRPERETQPAPR
jgi:hypothetical protein